MRDLIKVREQMTISATPKAATATMRWWWGLPPFKWIAKWVLNNVKDYTVEASKVTIDFERKP